MVLASEALNFGRNHNAMIPQVLYLTAEMPVAMLFGMEPSTLLVDRIVFHTNDPQWPRRLAKAALSVVTLVTEDHPVNPKNHELAEHVCKFGELCGEAPTAPVFEPEGGWSITPGYVPEGDARHVWSHSLSLKDTLVLEEDEAIELTIRSSADLKDLHCYLLQLVDEAEPDQEDLG